MIKDTIKMIFSKNKILKKRDRSSSLADRDEEESPGPGTYLKRSTLTGPYWRFGRSTRDSSSFTLTPGPGAYEVFNGIGKWPGYVQKKPAV